MGVPTESGGTVSDRAISAWTGSHVRSIGERPHDVAPPIRRSAVQTVIRGIDIWDAWPVQDRSGHRAAIAGGTLWFALSAPAVDAPVLRHGRARLRLLHCRDGAWSDLGNALPDGLSPGSREWSGSAVLTGDTVTLFFTAAGVRGEPVPTMAQRMFQTSATLSLDNGRPALADWQDPVESILPDPALYMLADAAEGQVGEIKAFRDPAHFRDPATGLDHLLFCGSAAGSPHAHNGVAGIATSMTGLAGPWRLESPLLSADGVNNELERPHMLIHDGRYYLFWSTQRHVFAPDVAAGPTGLYGMVGETVRGPFAPLNGSGLIFANPPEAPAQAYSWLVMDGLHVTSFADLPETGDPAALDAAAERAAFAGTFAPMLRLWIDGDRAGLSP